MKALGVVAAIAAVYAFWAMVDKKLDTFADKLGVERIECDAMYDVTCTVRQQWAWAKGLLGWLQDWNSMEPGQHALARATTEADLWQGTHILDLGPEAQDKRIASMGEALIAHYEIDEDRIREMGDEPYRAMTLMAAPDEASRREMSRIVLVQLQTTADTAQEWKSPDEQARTLRAIRHRMCAALDRSFRIHTYYPETPVRNIWGEDIEWDLGTCQEGETMQVATDIIRQANDARNKK